MRRLALAALISFVASSPLPAAAQLAEVAPRPGPLAEVDTEPGPGIHIRVTGLRSDDGHLVCGLFVEENWLGAGAVSGKGGEISEGVAACRFHDIESGTYAISTFHDENDDGRLDTGFMRIPKEGTAASNDAYRKFGPPRYRDAKFDYDGGVLELEAEMRYIGGGKKKS